MTEDEVKRADEAYALAIEREDYAAAIEALDSSIELSSSSASTFRNRADAYVKLGNDVRALEDYHRAVELDGKDEGVYRKRGSSYFSLNMLDAALTDFNQAIALKDDDSAAYYNRGCLYLELKDYAAAIDDFTRAIEIDPGGGSAYGNRGNCYDLIGDFQKAVGDFDRAIEVNAEDVFAYFNRGNDYFKLEQYERAIESYSLGLSLAPGEERLLLQRARAYSKNEEYEQAIADYSALVDANSDFTIYALLERAEAHVKLGRDDFAEEDRHRAKEEAVFYERLQHHTALDEQLIAQMRSMGDSLDVARVIDHLFVCSPSNSEDLKRRLEMLGFDVVVKEAGFSRSKKTTVEFQEKATPNQMRERSRQFVRIAFECGASYDGWGCNIVNGIRADAPGK
ncbi:MAG: tetratricopeptide repeat protein [Candidatus Melainabacteria bacterium]|nr:tetratricopeptide repeat protein [Candidatus Melainabacteria bacterium]